MINPSATRTIRNGMDGRIASPPCSSAAKSLTKAPVKNSSHPALWAFQNQE